MLPMIKGLNTCKSPHSNNRGFTLIEMAISLVIIGLLSAPFFKMYSNYQTSEKIRVTDTHVQRAIASIHEYRTANGAYPCPSRMTDSNGAVTYGHSALCNTAAYSPVTITPGTCSADGICMERAVGFGLGGRGDVLTDPNVIVGALPYRDLQLDEDSSLDGYGGRLIYAVTYSMTSLTSFDDSMGAISIIDEAGNDRVLPKGSADYIVISTGKTRQGGYGREGNLYTACPGIGVTTDAQNCNVGFDTGVAVTPDSVYMASLRNDASGASFYDDSIEYFSQNKNSPWKRTTVDKENIESLVLDNVGIGTSDPTSTLTIEGAGATPALRVSGVSGNDGQVFTELVCSSGGNCFRPENFSGDNTANPATVSAPDPSDLSADIITPGEGMKCPAGQYMVGIVGGGSVCKDDIKIVCPTYKPVMIGVDAAGKPKCAKIPEASCAAKLEPQCAGHPTKPTVSLPITGDGGKRLYQKAGDCRTEHYICDNGTWKDYAWKSGACTDSVATVTPHSCTSVTGYGPGGSSTYTTTGGTTCNPWSGGSTFSADCNCVGLPAETRNCPSCPSGFAPTPAVPTYQRERRCTANVLNWNWTILDGTPAGLPYNSTNRTAVCGPTSSYCSCVVPTVTLRATKNKACPDPSNQIPDPLTGYKIEEYFDAPSCSWKPTGNLIGSCICKAGNVSQTGAKPSCPSCDEDGVRGTDVFARHPTTCKKTGAPLPPPISTPGYCAKINFAWSDIGSSSATGFISLDVGDPCSCSSPINVANCKNSGGNARRCKCQAK